MKVRLMMEIEIDEHAVVRSAQGRVPDDAVIDAIPASFARAVTQLMQAAPLPGVLRVGIIAIPADILPPLVLPAVGVIPS